ncbi:hypothetical protein ALI22I_05335 [Saccharothrix sp. ALI-22-I]|uniref:WXG100 family type VII secretion target n=1 Tax=Saccharothrix sp. ALI-22-I TaxID=1933778 RepID=UPI00097CBF65|nr:WXG100 family type VII secretion target [Saccharothrix sp. ALI-22-I]ONI92211.1 hypothetical protein ALI22I_05335 [Saccharothrix sp. ALI-22-I]
MGGVDGAFDEAISSIESALKKMRKARGDIIDHVNWALKFLPDGIADQVRRATQKLDGEVSKSENSILDLLLERGSPAALREAASEWNSKVAAVAGRQAVDLAFGSMPSNGNWKGDAQLAYRSVIDQQNKALTDLKPVFDELNSTLNDIADALKDFWIQFASAVTLLCVAIMICALETIGVITIEAAITTGLAAVGLFVSSVLVIDSLFESALDSNKARLEKLITTNGVEGIWPAPAADFSDASVLDGDNKSDWEPIF